tara:strand:+ start:977 stop:2125 length:1149 start_codon:yes stop_codon:yes gene_type:complete
MLKDKKIIYFYVSGRKNRIESNTTGSKEFFYGYKYLNKKNIVEIIEFNDNLPKRKFTVNILDFFDKVLRKLTSLPIFTREIVSFYNLKKIQASDYLILTNDRIGCSLLPIMIYLKFFNKKRIKSTIFILGVFSNKNKNFFISIFQKLYINLFLSSYDNFVFLGEGEFNYALNAFKKYKHKFYLLPFSVDEEFWKLKEKKNFNDSEYILFVGNDGNREFKKVIEIAKLLPEFKFLFVTNQIDEKDIKSENIKLIKGHWNHEYITDEDLKEIYSKAFISILPLRNSLQPSGQSVALQSMSMNIPVLITDTDGFWDKDSFKDGENIIFLKNNSLENWVSKIKDLLENKKRLDEISLNGKNTIDSKFKLIDFNKNLEKIIIGKNEN